MILWLCGSLPWEKLLDPVTVQKEKEKAFANINDFLKKCFCGLVPQAIHKFMTLLAAVKFNEIPCYEKLKEVLISGLKKINHKPDEKLRLDSIGKSTQANSSRSTPQKMKKSIDKIRKSPRMKRTRDVPSPVRTPIRTPVRTPVRRNPRDSTIGVVMDKKRCNVKDIEKALDDMDSDCEYDIQILKKAKKTESKDKTHEVMESTVSEDDSKMKVIIIKREACNNLACA